VKNRGIAIQPLFLLPSAYIFAIAAHIISGGEILGASPLALQFGCIALVLLIAKNVELEGPTLALVVALIQSTSHFILGGNSYTSELSMTFAHLISGFATYWLVKYFDLAWKLSLEVIRKIFLPKLPSWRVPSRPLYFGLNEYRIPEWRLRLINSLKYRGPPLGLEINYAS
jgi:hypothetical protein